jgi:long-chain acyl-CoA synthetase
VGVAGDPWSAGLPRAGEWLRTGDRGVRNSDGTFAIRGLSKPMFTRNGFNIYPREIERVVRELAGVQDVRVSAVPDALRENDIHVDVTGGVAEADVKTWCDSRLSVYKRPSSITVTDART